MHATVTATQHILQSVTTHRYELVAVLISGIVAYFATVRFVQGARIKLIQRRLCGIDINKTTPEQRKKIASKPYDELDEGEKRLVVPESFGILAGAVYLSAVLITTSVAFGGVSRQLDGSVTSIAVMLLLGFVDDVLDLRWRYKILLSAIGTIPLVMTFKGSLEVIVPRLLAPYLGSPTLYLGVFYLVGLSLLCIFCTNSINILAGVNGVEVGQSIVIAVASIVHCIMQMRLESDPSYGGPATSGQLLAIALLVPFVGVSAALWRFNSYPASIFVGDSYTYFAGTVLSVAGVTGVYSKTLMLFFVPQLVNFAISLPQLLRIVPCPRHRVPRWDMKRDVMQNSGNYTLLNAILLLRGDMHERDLTRAALKLQIVSCIVAMFARYFLASLLYDHVY
ncbi:UDP-N-acetylglucosamine-dolichyl-phosphate N-acetylglucosaminephosphotransferase, putative [Trypanosoma equiperdum]|uniref:UDP-N-acetylglucosamine--dolichyl-phosphate N-acetylglucosaminephosphotransferase n=2 Tax=Trypanozoon TaxID=39700 RepID=Q383N4_TRYB2|nr:UDP-N-acetylglucosamine--dolichyl-phosphate n- acetylglucosaminephosphotransferase, putative [Trypanosoma brucei brucei TREU927]EAN79997.1 UDP-N-acetylglucosamine--dolichyl-phosphate n- acetylglucosaminephosphotransferase, putative [Trypanosoma brucei brucei TREU927]SCU72791.1 UDP-N-acetylglucosamine-dolichyl-phosphate N-acetylglucosaminephosphotransferase, putative [Trypanosoma equiperdum]